MLEDVVDALCLEPGVLLETVAFDRGLDIDQAFFNQHSLTFLAHKGVTPPQAPSHGETAEEGFRD